MKTRRQRHRTHSPKSRRSPNRVQPDRAPQCDPTTDIPTKPPNDPPELCGNEPAAPPDTPRGARTNALRALEPALTARLLDALDDDQIAVADLSRFLSAFAAVHRALTARRELELEHGVTQPPTDTHPPATAPQATDVPMPDSPGAADSLNASPAFAAPSDSQPSSAHRAREVTYVRGRPAPKRRIGYSADAPYGRKPDGTPYTAREFAVALRDAVQSNWGLEIPDPSKPAHPATPTDSSAESAPPAPATAPTVSQPIPLGEQPNREPQAPPSLSSEDAQTH